MALGIGSRTQRLTPGRPVQIDDETAFAGGLNTVSAEDALQPNQFRRGDNGRLTQFGAFTKRGGTQRTAGALIAATAVQNGYPWNQANGSTVTMAVCGGTLFTTTYGTFPLTWTQRGSVGALSTITTPSLAQFVSAGGTEAVYIADGGLLNKYQGTTLTTNLAGTPSVKVIAVHNQRLWGVGDPTYPDSVWYSPLNDGDNLGVGANGGGQIIVRTFGSQNLIGLASVGTSLLMFHDFGVSRLTGYGQDDVTVAPAGITKDVGCVAPFSIVVVNNVCFFITERGLYLANEQEVIPVSTPEQPDPLSIILPQMSLANIANVRAVLNRGTRELEIYVPGYGLYLYHTILKAWCGPWIDGYVSPETSCLFESSNASNYPIVLRGDAQGFVSETDRPNVYLDNVAADGTGGTTYASTLQCRRMYSTDPMIAKSWRFGYVLASLNGSAACTVNWSTNSTSGAQPLPASTGGSWGTGTWGSGTWGAPGQFPYRIQMDGNGYYVDLAIVDSGAALPVFSQARVQGFVLGRR